jgi:formate/nitrite transporter FocA (FNT family)
MCALICGVLFCGLFYYFTQSQWSEEYPHCVHHRMLCKHTHMCALICGAGFIYYLTHHNGGRSHPLRSRTIDKAAGHTHMCLYVVFLECIIFNSPQWRKNVLTAFTIDSSRAHSYMCALICGNIFGSFILLFTQS